MNSILSLSKETSMVEKDEGIPLIDFDRFLHGNEAEQRHVSAQIGRACEQIGFFYLTNFGFTAEQFDRVYHQAKIFFDQTLEKKMHLFIGSSTINRGYTPFLEEKLAPQGDWKEAFDFAYELDENDPDRIHRHASLYGPNRWPTDLPGPSISPFTLVTIFLLHLHLGFRECLYEEFYLSVVQLGLKLLEAFALALGLERDHFRGMFAEKPMVTMRIIHYPSSNEPNQIGCGEHTDYECFTLLSQTNQSALQILRADGRWIDAPPIPKTFVVNIGDLMQRWTNDRFRSTVHRVINLTGEDRFSIPIFFGPNYFTLISPLFQDRDQDDDDEAKKKYPTILAGHYLEQRFDQTYQYRMNNNN